MSTIERWALRIGFALAVGTGLAYGYVRYLGRVQGEFGPEPHAWQAFAQHAYVLTAPVFLFALGVAIRGHVRGMLRHKVTRGRSTGLMLAALSAPMVFGGFAIQVVTASTTRTTLGYAHSAVSALFALLYGLHWTKPRSAPALGRSMPAASPTGMEPQISAATLPSTSEG